MERVRVRAPELDGEGGWIGVDELSLAQLRGKVVLLDFWTLACVNCQRVVEELRGLERRFADVLVTIGVHSPKFPHEHDHGAVRAAVARHRIEHPVLDDPAMATWDAYAIRAWPTLVLIDVDGRVALTVSGEGKAVQLAAAIEELVAEADAAGTLRRGPLELDAADAAQGTGELAFPGKVAIEDGATRAPRVAIADSGHDRVLICSLNGEVEIELDGLYQPQGVRFDGVGDTAALLVCETGADRVWRIPLDGRGKRELLTDQLRSPWDVIVWHGHTVIAEAGRHRLWAVDRAGELQILAGTGAEALVDGPGLEAVLAQPSGMTLTADGDLAFLDAEASALRVGARRHVRRRDARGRRAVRMGRGRRRPRARAAAASARPHARRRRRALRRRHLQQRDPRLARLASVDRPGRGLRRAGRDRGAARRPPAGRRHRQPPHRPGRPAARAGGHARRRPSLVGRHAGRPARVGRRDDRASPPARRSRSRSTWTLATTTSTPPAVRRSASAPSPTCPGCCASPRPGRRARCRSRSTSRSARARAA